MNSETTYGSAWAEIDLAALRWNTAALRCAAPGAAIAAVVKANGYGHGAVEAARAALEGGAERLCVFAPQEAIALREAGLRAPILALGPLPADQVELAARLDLTVSLRRIEEVEACAAAARAEQRETAVHINIDGGMQRLGLGASEAIALAAAVRAHDSLRLEGVYTHFPDAAAADPAPTRRAFERFLETANAIGAPIRHAAASAALLRFPEMALEMTRPGIALYGASPFGASVQCGGAGVQYGLRPALSWRAALLDVREVPAGESVSYGGLWTARRDSRIGVAGVGYADGLPRRLWNHGEMLVRGRRAPITGTICMDMTMVDLTEIPEAAAGDTATLIGVDGAEQIQATELAEQAGTLSYELLTGIAPRVQRVYT